MLLLLFELPAVQPPRRAPAAPGDLESRQVVGCCSLGPQFTLPGMLVPWSLGTSHCWPYFQVGALPGHPAFRGTSNSPPSSLDSCTAVVRLPTGPLLFRGQLSLFPSGLAWGKLGEPVKLGSMKE